jgi:hypothetical protein
MLNGSRFFGLRLSLCIAALTLSATALAGEAERQAQKSANENAAEKTTKVAKACEMPKLAIEVDWKGFEASKADETAYRFAWEGVNQLYNAVGDYCKDDASNRKALKDAKVEKLVVRLGAPNAKLEGKSVVCFVNKDDTCRWSNINEVIKKF